MPRKFVHCKISTDDVSFSCTFLHSAFQLFTCKQHLTKTEKKNTEAFKRSIRTKNVEDQLEDIVLNDDVLNRITWEKRTRKNTQKMKMVKTYFEAQGPSVDGFRVSCGRQHFERMKQNSSA